MLSRFFRNDTTKSTLQLEDLEKIFFLTLKKNQLDALLLSASEPLLYKNFGKFRYGKDV